MTVRKQLDYILKYANDIILLIDKDMKIIEANERAIEVYKYSCDELIGMEIMKLQLPESAPLLDEQIKILDDIRSTRYKTIHKCKDGTIFPVELSVSLAEVEGVKYYLSIGRDITEQRMTENKLNQLIERFNLATRAAKLAVWDWNVVNDQLIWDDRIYELYGVNKEEFPPVYASWLKIVHPDDVEKVNDEITRALTGQKEYNTEFRVTTPDGSIRYIKAFGQVVRNKDGNPSRMIGINYDITEQKITEILISESEEKFRKIFEESPIATAMSSKSFNFVRVNPSFCKLLGYNERDIINFTFRDFTHPEHVKKDESSLNELIEGKIPIYRTEKRYIRKDKSIIWGSTTVSAIKDRNGHIQYFLVMIEDITLRKEAEIQIEESNSLLRATLESTADGILVVDMSGKIVQFNRKFSEMWEIPDTILDLRDDEKALSFVRNQLKDPESFLNNVRYLYGKPESVSFDLLDFNDGRVFERYSQPQKINNEIIGRVWSFRDITQRKIAEDQLVSAKEKAEESDRLKTAFLHNISHEIRTPMNAIVGFTALLNDSDLQPENRKQFIEIIDQSSDQLLSIITDIVDISNIETGQTKVSLNQININSTIRNLFEQYNPRSKQQGLSISYKLFLDDDKALIETDGTKLIQILSNLLNNSLKFTNEGKIEFGYIVKDSFVEFMVRDTGIGIAEDKQTKIFERFYQVENSISRQYGGAGLGLSICRAYTELLGGCIRVESQPGKGSTFYFTLPLKSVGKKPPAGEYVTGKSD